VSSDCLFCKIVRREIPASIVHEDEEVLAFKDINPQAPTHVLVTPKRHVPRLADLEPADAALAGTLATRLARIAKDLGLEDYRVVVNNGRGAGQLVFHVHLHLLAGRAFSWPPG
jgi:histidine triad (HIT) family protein